MEPRKLDPIDRRILAALARDGRLTNAELAEQVGLSPSPCWQRTRRLEAEGFIRGYAAVLDQTLLGAPETVILEVTLDRHDDTAIDTFTRALQTMPEVLEAHLTAGEYDFIIKIAVNGTRGYEDFLRRKLYPLPGIRHTRSSFTLRCVKQGGAPIPE